MTVHATGNDDQAWWALAAMIAFETGLTGGPWLEMARNVFNQQKSRWDMSRCNGGMKWKVVEEDDDWHYKSSIANGLFFHLAARLAKAGDGDAQQWADRIYDWVTSVGLIDDYNVFDGTDDAKETGCVDVNHTKWSYNVGAFLYGAAAMAAKTRDSRWIDRMKGFIASAKRSFTKDGALCEFQCEDAGDCNTDQVPFEGTLARWLCATAGLLPEIRGEIADILSPAAAHMLRGPTSRLGPIDSFNALETVVGSLNAQGPDTP